ncbi:hypothetical protein Athai_12060 [Actinocatenispora thailandica]|uniref:SnoaL-like domain-containing protein n=1 Tax=Actinocatenispora thailandica TaxID=227318 RepID=A0A7R7DLA3_9ACTN|nr:nuclear transport factor 2 family protein [Actinocatenispora thailandica]BCJ33703.1 hypothetical protein Athai_12060 [Actinocatenispora thailandica]
MASTAGPREVLARFRDAAIGQSTDGMRRLYAADAIHEFPFHRPGVPARLTGRDEIVAWTAAGWRARRFEYERYRTLAVHDTGDPGTIVVEQQAIGRNTASGREFVLPNIVVLTVRHGLIGHLRDYVNLVAVDAALS